MPLIATGRVRFHTAQKVVQHFCAQVNTMRCWHSAFHAAKCQAHGGHLNKEGVVLELYPKTDTYQNGEERQGEHELIKGVHLGLDSTETTGRSNWAEEEETNGLQQQCQQLHKCLGAKVAEQWRHQHQQGGNCDGNAQRNAQCAHLLLGLHTQSEMFTTETFNANRL